MPGSWLGHPSGLAGARGGSRVTPLPERQRASMWFPYRKMGQSVADIVVDTTDGKFGPFAGQVFCGDQTIATVMRVAFEKVTGKDGKSFYQGACFPFREGLDCGVNRLAFDNQGAMLVGETDRGWGSVGRRRYGLQRIAFTGKTPFEILTMQAAPDGFVLTFTQDIDKTTAADPKSYKMSSYTYEYHARYGSDEMDTKQVAIKSAALLGPRTVRLVVDELRSGDEGLSTSSARKASRAPKASTCCTRTRTTRCRSSRRKRRRSRIRPAPPAEAQAGGPALRAGSLSSAPPPAARRSSLAAG